jgi:hypothetical protein
MIPVELLPPGQHSTVDLSINLFHGSVNVLGFVPVGLVLGDFGVLPAVTVAALMSGVAETSQLAMLYRDSSLSDFVTNVIGAFIGAVIAARWKIRSPSLKISRWTTLLAAAVAFTLLAQAWAEKGPPVSTHGVTSQGTIEAHWKLDEASGRVASDSSGNGLNGRFGVQPQRVSGPTATSVMFDGNRQYVDFGRSTALRLAGSMTVTAWINSSFFPYDDAAVVSQLHGRFGYQLDTTVDKGPRTIGFKLTNACGDLMARYGATPLIVGVWYHIAGVYDAPKRTLDVYLNGKLDDGPLVGTVTTAQHSSRWPVYIGKRSDLEGFGFAGSIRDVRIYSFALTHDEIAAVVRGNSLNGRADHPANGSAANNTSEEEHAPDRNAQCAVISEGDDQQIPPIAASLGVLVVIACIGLWPSASLLLYVFCSLAAGLFLLPAIAPNVPSFNLWLIPLVTVAGGVSVVISAEKKSPHNREISKKRAMS